MSGSRVRGSRIDRAGDSLTISVRTYRSGDFAHFIFAVIAVVFGSLVAWIGLRNGTLFASWATLPLVVGCFGYAWFAITRAVNRRTLRADQKTLTVSDGPLPSLARGVTIGIDQLGKVRLRKQKRWIPPIYFHEVYHVEVAGTSRALFRSMDSEDDATRIKAALMAHRAEASRSQDG